MQTTAIHLGLGAALLVGALLASPRVGAAQEAGGLPPVPPTAVLMVAALGRDDATADVLWLQIVQYIGSPNSEAEKYARMEDWVDAIADLSPEFELPYLLTGILLATSPDRADAADRILARGEAVLPDRWIFPLQRGFVAYFGKLDFEAAAEHYRRASSFPGSPPYLASFVRRLEKSASSCAALRGDLGTVVGSTTDARQGDAIKKGAAGILVHCAESEIRAAMGIHRLKHGGHAPTVDDLVTEGILKAPPWAPSGMCWTIVLEKGKLAPCTPPPPSAP